MKIRAEEKIIINNISKILKKNSTFIQVGSCDHNSNDPIKRFIKNCRGGLLIEPVVELSDKLKKKYYKYHNIRVIGKAVSDYNGIGKFYKLNTKALKLYSTPDFANELGSLNKSNLLKCFGGTLGNYVDELNVELRTLNSIIEENKDLFTRGIDLIHIDAEGHDFKIIKNLNFDKYAPAAILLEHKNLDTNDKQQLNSFLTSKQYKISMYKYDLLAVRMG